MKKGGERLKGTRGKFLAFLIFIAFFIFVGVILLQRSSPDVVVASRVVSIPANEQTADSFVFGGVGVQQSMAAGCNVPAALKLDASSLKSPGKLLIYINDFYVGHATITSIGQVMISSGCGCATSCVCEIRGGENLVKLISQGFAGEIKYEVTVKK